MEKNIFLIETNYYNRDGGKLKSTIGEFKNLNTQIENKYNNNCVFLWVTAGKAFITKKGNPSKQLKDISSKINIFTISDFDNGKNSILRTQIDSYFKDI